MNTAEYEQIRSDLWRRGVELRCPLGSDGPWHVICDGEVLNTYARRDDAVMFAQAYALHIPPKNEQTVAKFDLE
jgi:hypothetical protein